MTFIGTVTVAEWAKAGRTGLRACPVVTVRGPVPFRGFLETQEQIIATINTAMTYGNVEIE